MRCFRGKFQSSFKGTVVLIKANRSPDNYSNLCANGAVVVKKRSPTKLGGNTHEMHTSKTDRDETDLYFINGKSASASVIKEASGN